MLSKEEIEKQDREHIKKVLTEYKNYIFEFDTDNIKTDDILEYIEQLESDNYEQNNIINGYIDERQKLIEKLEEDEYIIESTYSQINGNYFMAQDKLDYIREILSILKEENQVIVK